MTEFGVITQVGRGIFLGVSDAHILREWAPSFSIFWDPYTYAETA